MQHQHQHAEQQLEQQQQGPQGQQGKRCCPLGRPAWANNTAPTRRRGGGFRAWGGGGGQRHRGCHLAGPRVGFLTWLVLFHASAGYDHRRYAGQPFSVQHPTRAWQPVSRAVLTAAVLPLGKVQGIVIGWTFQLFEVGACAARACRRQWAHWQRDQHGLRLPRQRSVGRALPHPCIASADSLFALLPPSALGCNAKLTGPPGVAYVGPQGADCPSSGCGSTTAPVGVRHTCSRRSALRPCD